MDINRDGHQDILSGSYSRHSQPMAGTFQVLYGTKDGGLKVAEELKGTDGKVLEIPYGGEDNMVRGICTRPSAVDWDGDGALDLVVGNFEGTFFLFKGVKDGGFEPKPEQIMTTGGSPLSVQAHSDPFPVDWDGDGDLDLLSGSAQGGVFMAENKAGKGKAPALEAFRALLPSLNGHHVEHEIGSPMPTTPAGSTRVWAADVNGDGKLDLLVGDHITLNFPAEGVSAEEAKKRVAEIEAQPMPVWPQGPEPDATEEATKRFEMELERAQGEYEKRQKELEKVRKSEMTGFVWLYLRK